MKVLTLFFLTVLFFSSAAFAEPSTYESVKVPSVKTPEAPKIPNSQALNRIRDVERQLNYIEQQNRLQEDQIRRLERSVDDLKRRR